MAESYEFRKWLDAAAPGERFVYHRGFLAVDCAEKSADGAALCIVRDLALKASEAGLVALSQRRHCEGLYTYFATKRRFR